MSLPGPCTETWVSVVGYEGLYEVSDMGRVRSLDRVHQSRNRWGPVERRLLGGTKALTVDPHGYLQVRLCKDGRAVTLRVNRVVATAFLGAPSDREEACHKNHTPSDNRVGNLYWGTRLENEQDKTLALRRNPYTEISREKVFQIREMYAKKRKQIDIAIEIGCSKITVWNIIHHKSRNVY